MSADLPLACRGCTKEGMVAIACPFLTEVPEDLLFSIQCKDAHKSKAAKTATGGKVFGSFRMNSKAVPVNDAPGRATASHPHIKPY